MGWGREREDAFLWAFVAEFFCWCLQWDSEGVGIGVNWCELFVDGDRGETEGGELLVGDRVGWAKCQAWVTRCGSQINLLGLRL